MARSTTSKELLELESRVSLSASDSDGLLICGGRKESLRRRRGKKVPCADAVSFTSVPPRSQVLGKLQNFLGIMAEANKQLELKKKEDPNANYDIEALNGSETEIIEMDLLLGVADLQTPEALAAAEVAITSSRHDLTCNSIHKRYDMDNSDDDSSDDENHSDADANNDCQGAECTTNDSHHQSLSKRSKASQSIKRPKIVALN